MRLSYVLRFLFFKEINADLVTTFDCLSFIFMQHEQHQHHSSQSFPILFLCCRFFIFLLVVQKIQVLLFISRLKWNLILYIFWWIFFCCVVVRLLLAAIFIVDDMACFERYFALQHITTIILLMFWFARKFPRNKWWIVLMYLCFFYVWIYNF